jgi:betaine-aldehyde dehydrogenase
MTDRYHRHDFFIGGQWRAPSTAEKIVVISPTTQEQVGTAPAAAAGDIDAAVAAARQAFDAGPWPRLSASERAAVLHSMADYLDKHGDEIVEMITAEMGSPRGRLRAGTEAAILRYYAEMARDTPLEAPRQGLLGPARVVHEPVGVVAAITPWNGPLYILALKIAPALAAGCTVVAKPPPETPLVGYYLAEAAAAAGLPPGVLNITPGGREAGEFLVSHRGVDKVAFTGSTAAGRRIGAICGEQLKRCSLELGGKSAAVVLDDASVDQVVASAIPFGLGFNNGQACAALTRIIVPRRRQAEFVDALAAAVNALVVGDPRDTSTHVGPLVAERQRARVEHYIKSGIDSGAKLVAGGGRPKHLDRGWFVEPTLFDEVDNKMVIAREEIFGPVGVVIPYDGGDDEAIAIANDSPYGLAGAVFSADTGRAASAASRVRAGTVGLNSFYIDLGVPFGGFKDSGIGREMSKEGLFAYTEVKSIVGSVGSSSR